jgi:hypothetical protein
MIETEYRGYKITFSENADEWNCYAISFSHASLAKVRAKIDRIHLDMRKAAAFDCLYIGSAYGKPDDVTGARVIDYRLCREKNRSAWTGKGPDIIEKHEVAAMVKSGFADSAGKNWLKLQSLAPLGPETDAAMDRVREAQRKVEAAEKERAQAWASVPRLTFDDVTALAAAAEAQIEEGE